MKSHTAVDEILFVEEVVECEDAVVLTNKEVEL